MQRCESGIHALFSLKLTNTLFPDIKLRGGGGGSVSAAEQPHGRESVSQYSRECPLQIVRGLLDVSEPGDFHRVIQQLRDRSGLDQSGILPCQLKRIRLDSHHATIDSVKFWIRPRLKHLGETVRPMESAQLLNQFIRVIGQIRLGRCGTDFAKTTIEGALIVNRHAVHRLTLPYRMLHDGHLGAGIIKFDQ